MQTCIVPCYCITFIQGSDRFWSRRTALTKPVPDCRRSSSFSNKLLLKFMSTSCIVASHGRADRRQQLDLSLLSREDYITSNKILSIPNNNVNIKARFLFKILRKKRTSMMWFTKLKNSHRTHFVHFLEEQLSPLHSCLAQESRMFRKPCKIHVTL